MKNNSNTSAFAAVGEGLATPGMTKRELIAAMALQGLLADDGRWESYTGPAMDAVRAADALLEALEK